MSTAHELLQFLADNSLLHTPAPRMLADKAHAVHTS
jgi:hypothetical protein